MKRRASLRAVRIEREGPVCLAACPFCLDGWRQALNETMPWCVRCGCEYTVRPFYVMFDQEKKTDRFAFAKAVNLAGGLRLGRTKR